MNNTKTINGIKVYEGSFNAVTYGLSTLTRRRFLSL